jgi:predicted PurR-regulated permease PerM
MEDLTIAKLQRITFKTLLFFLFSFMLIYSKTLLVPLAWAFMISLSSMRIVGKTHEWTKLPYSVVVLLYMTLLFSLIGGILFFFTIELDVLLSDMGLIQEKLSIIMHDFSHELMSIGVTIPDHYDPEYFKSVMKEHNSVLLEIASGLGSNLWDFILVIFYTFFILANKDLVIQFVDKKYNNDEDKEKIKVLTNKILDIIQQYVGGMFLLGLIIAVLSYILLIAFGIKAALFFSVFFGILSLIPVIGVPIGMVVISLFALLTSDSPMTAVYIAGALFVLNFLQDNILRPMIMGSKLSVNAFTVFFFVILGGFYWGVSGMILFIPLASIMKIILDRTENGSYYSVLLSELPKKEKSRKKSSNK